MSPDPSGPGATLPAFPRAPLSLGVVRRGFLPALRSFATACRGEMAGRRSLDLSELGCWSDGELATVVPAFLPGCEVGVEGNRLWVRAPGAATSTSLCLAEAEALRTLRRFRGDVTLGAIAGVLQAETGWPAESCFGYVRALFLSLVVARACRPANLV